MPYEPIEETTDAERDAATKEYFAQLRISLSERREAARQAPAALARLVKVMAGRSGQPYKLRSILYSLWNGKPTSMVEVTGLDWALRKDLCAVILAFGYEDDGAFDWPGEKVAFFYDAIKDGIKAGGQWDWFMEEQNVNNQE